jgi:hypothetical protein
MCYSERKKVLREDLRQFQLAEGSMRVSRDFVGAGPRKNDGVLYCDVPPSIGSRLVWGSNSQRVYSSNHGAMGIDDLDFEQC